jgi:hypothetical protein
MSEKSGFKIVFRPICWITEIYYGLRYGCLISGCDYLERADGSLKCQICGKVSK